MTSGQTGRISKATPFETTVGFKVSWIILLKSFKFIENDDHEIYIHLFGDYPVFFNKRRTAMYKNILQLLFTVCDIRRVPGIDRFLFCDGKNTCIVATSS